MNIYRQGDVLLVQVEGEGIIVGQPIPREGRKIVLAYGEVTGHSHAIADAGVKFIQVGAERFLTSDKPFTVKHQEHAPISVPAGTFKVVRQREYSPESIRIVAD